MKNLCLKIYGIFCILICFTSCKTEVSGNSNNSSGAGVSFFILYNLDGGELTEDAPRIYTYGAGTVLKLPKPVKNDYVFTGWTYDGKTIEKIDDTFYTARRITKLFI